MKGKEKYGGRGIALLLFGMIIANGACANYPSGTDRPSTGGDSYSTLEDTEITVEAKKGILANDSAKEGSKLTLLTTGKLTTEKKGIVLMETDGGFTYTPPSDFSGTDSLVYKVSNDPGKTSKGVLTIMVVEVNDMPGFTADDLAQVSEDAGQQTIDQWTVFDPGCEAEGDQAATYLVDQIGNPALFAEAPMVAENGTLTFTPAGKIGGTSTFNVRVKDSGGTANGGKDICETQTFTIAIAAVNDAPVTVADTASGVVDLPMTIQPVDNDTDVDTANNQLIIVSVELTSGVGSLAFIPRAVVYQPSAGGGAPREDIITYTISDNDAHDPKTATGTIKVNISELADISAKNAVSSAVARTDHYLIRANRTLAVTAAKGVLANDRDPLGAKLSVAAPLEAESLHGGTLRLAKNGGFEFTPAANFIGEDSFTYAAVPAGNFDTAYRGKAVVTVVADDITVNSATCCSDSLLDSGALKGSMADQNNYSGMEDQPLIVDGTGQVLANQPNLAGGALFGSGSEFVSSHFGGKIFLRPDGAFIYKPAANFEGIDCLNPRAKKNAAVDQFAITVNVANANDPPFAQDDHYAAHANESMAVSQKSGVLDNDCEADDEPLSVATLGNIATDRGGLVQMQKSGAFIYTPAPGFSGLDCFDYTVGDGTGLFDAATVSIAIAP